MAATVSAWSKPGAWALDSEEHESELLQPQPVQPAVSDFPSLAAAAATKPKKKKKPQTLSLAEFTAKPDEDLNILSLPTAPRERTAEEIERDRTRLGGGFRSYGDRGGRNSGPGGDDGSNSRWGSSRVSDESRRSGSFGSRDLNRDSAPSRADEIDNWASVKKSSIGNGFERRERERGGFFDSQSRADESDRWVSNKSVMEGRRFGSNGGGFERERKIGFGFSGGADSDNWNKKKVESNVGIESGNGSGGFERERKVGFGASGAADSDNWNKKKVESNGGSERPGSGSGGGGRPRLVLQPRSISASNQSSPDSDSGNVVKPKGPNPFGEAKPREQVLAEKGQDWKKIDQQLESVKIKETVEKSDGGFGKKDFGSGNGRATSPEDRTEKSWRKILLADPRPRSVEKVEDQHVEEN
ncbi:PREDICTED: eukaryotic translation initiation factor 4B3-like [Lupinus angustifolius]|uniref:eukaryotic translation initiation factor 4B3-like n=1 Tax=Lupinus angustifolius TaxID=3871 RepID=UPI00092EC69A|nr:PREDICTED: eukaryotic translation initiation factor 4B3-like [Lupinus angustifolius]